MGRGIRQGQGEGEGWRDLYQSDGRDFTAGVYGVILFRMRQQPGEFAVDKLVIKDGEVFLEDIETAFSFMFDWRDVPETHTVGELFEVVCSKLAPQAQPTDLCLSMVVFHRLRRSLKAVRPDVSAVHPSTDLSKLLSPRDVRAFRDHLSTDHRLDMEPLPLTRLGLAAAVAAFLTGFAAFLALLPPWLGFWYVALALGAAAAMSFALTFVLPIRMHPEVSTLRDLTRRTAALNIGELIHEFGLPRERDLWRAFVDVMSQSLGRDLGGVHRGTRFA